MREEPNHHKPPRRKLCNRRRKFATGVAFVWLLSRSPDKAPDRPSDARKRTKKRGGVRIRTGSLVSPGPARGVRRGCRFNVPPRGTGRRGQVGTPRPRASGVGSAGVAGLGAFRGPMVFPTLMFSGVAWRTVMPFAFSTRSRTEQGDCCDHLRQPIAAQQIRV